MAVAELAWENGGPGKAEIARLYDSWVQEARQQRDAGAPAAESPADAGRG